MKNAKIFVAGHRGLVGSAIVRALRAKGFENILMRTRKELPLDNQNAVEAFFSKETPEYVFLAAAKVGGIHANDVYRGEFIYQNLMIQTNILHQSYLHHVKRLVFLGSSCIYPKHAPQPMKEEHLLTGKLEPTNSAYAVAKIAGIEMCHAYNQQYGVSFTPIMPTNLYGIGDNFDLMNSHVLPAMIRKFHLAKLALENNLPAIAHDEKRWGAIPSDLKQMLGLTSGANASPKVILWGTGSPFREFLHVDDMADACLFTMFETNQTHLVNIGQGKDISIKELASLVAEIVGYRGEIVWDSKKPDGTPKKLLDVSLMEQLGWKAQINLREGIERTYTWYCEQ